MSTTACFENIIGLSRKDCECVEDRPAGANVSNSGLYLDELDGLNLRMADAVRDCGDGGLWDMLDQARENAIEETKAELMACLSANTDRRRQPGISQIGDDKKISGSGVSLGHTWHGMTVQTAKVKGGTFRVTHIGTAFKSTGSITVHVYDREGSSPVANYVVPMVANRVTWTEIAPLSLDMSELGTANPRYWFVFQPTDGLKAMNSRINCGCGGFNPYWSESAPQYASSQQKQGKLWAEWSMAAGTFGSDIADRENWTTQNPTQGLLLRVAFDCDESTSFCADEPNYTTDPIQKVIAHAVRLRAGANLITRLMSSTKINQYTMTAGDTMIENRRRYEAEFKKRILDYVCPELSQENNVNRYGDCLTCRDQWGMRRSTMLG